MVEGPTLVREYLNSTETSAVFIESPQSAGEVQSGKRRMHRTVDLVRYGLDGNILIAGRRDTQVKFHGQCIQLEFNSFVHYRRYEDRSQSTLVGLRANPTFSHDSHGIQSSQSYTSHSRRKVDRIMLQKFGEGLTREQLHPYFLVDPTERRLPSAEIEKGLHAL